LAEVSPNNTDATVLAMSAARYLMDSDCPRLAHALDLGRIPRWRQQTRSGVSERVPMWQSCFVDGLRLPEVPDDNFRACRHGVKRLESTIAVRQSVGIHRKTKSRSALKRGHVDKWSKETEPMHIIRPNV